MLHIGYRLEMKEAYRILNVPIDETLSFWKQLEILQKYCNKPGISIMVYHLKTYCVCIGIKYEEVNDLSEHDTTVGSCITKLLSITQTIKRDLETLEADISLVTMKYVEGEEYVVRYPEPIIFNWEN
jgi:hypothetical protein